MNEENYKLKGLCQRCEHRACFFEYGHAPRSECKDIESAVMGCYMYKPVRPIVIKPRENDTRPMSLGILSCRVERVNVKPELDLIANEHGEGVLVYWVRESKIRYLKLKLIEWVEKRKLAWKTRSITLIPSMSMVLSKLKLKLY